MNTYSDNYDAVSLIFIFNPQTGLALTGPSYSTFKKQPLEWQNYQYSNERQRWSITNKGFLHYAPLRNVAMGWDPNDRKFYAMHINDPMCNIGWKIDDNGYIACKYGSLGTVKNNSKIQPEVGKVQARNLVEYNNRWSQIVSDANKQGLYKTY